MNLKLKLSVANALNRWCTVRWWAYGLIVCLVILLTIDWTGPIVIPTIYRIVHKFEKQQRRIGLSEQLIRFHPCRFDESEINKCASSDKNTNFARTHFMTLAGEGQLGNNMFQYAGLLAMASKLDYTPFVSWHFSAAKYFKLSHACCPPHPIYNMHSYNEKNTAEFDPALLTLPTDKNYTFMGYYQSWKYFNDPHMKAIIRQEFALKDEYINKAKNIFNGLDIKGIPIGLHVRRGDKNSRIELWIGNTIVDTGYVHKAREYYRNKYKNVTFIVCSDDMDWCRENLSAADTRFIDGGIGTHFAALTSCKHSIISTGTFSWWSAWLAGGDVVYYKNYPRKGSYLGDRYVPEDFFPPEWVGME